MSQPGYAPRRAALALLDAVLEDGSLLAELTGDKGPLARLEPGERARAQRLATATLRALEPADRILGPHLRKKPPLSVHNILRLATVELCSEGAAAHGVVNTAVDMTRRGRKTTHQAGMVNAVLRRVAESGPAAWAGLPPAKLPKWLRKQMIADYTKPVVEAMEASHALGAPLDLTVKSDAETWARKLGGQVLPSGSVRLQGAGQVSALDGFASGDWWVQDAAAALPVRILNPRPNERILDLCAAPGGKTMQMAAAGAQVTALDVSETRLKRVSENLARTGLQAEIVVGDALSHSADAYDAILLDAPCTATGTIRRHPDLPHAKDSANFAALFALQERMIDHAFGLLKPGGRMVFCTCSLLPDEGEIQIEDALKRNADMKIESDAVLVPGVQPDWQTAEGGLRLRPDFWAQLGGMDGFYMAQIRKSG